MSAPNSRPMPIANPVASKAFNAKSHLYQKYAAITIKEAIKPSAT